MRKSVLLDTSFFITLLDSNRPNHEAAKHYYRHFLENGFSLYLSTIAIAEYCHKGAISDLPLDRLIILPFNVPHALQSAKLNFQQHRQPDAPRIVAKDDFKLLGQAMSEKLGFLITDDANTLHRHAQTLKAQNVLDLRCVKLDEGFDVALVNADQQRELPPE